MLMAPRELAPLLLERRSCLRFRIEHMKGIHCHPASTNFTSFTPFLAKNCACITPLSFKKSKPVTETTTAGNSLHSPADTSCRISNYSQSSHGLIILVYFRPQNISFINTSSLS
ncbi:hypothetical protein POPTR_018G028450v4 [Populus trichocarpa]|uniref:Uncharacterized protein n=1 Tax=Populus trichocarpa TaxID=3694 RepID=A0ACC0RM90_POPTR|nr:hypothetical protein BDE02_18G023800 [Populus trichocarpa]KAI9378062.1 hypothetical protein POPTR_018G028450v4 [Populus trichocarpa]